MFITYGDYEVEKLIFHLRQIMNSDERIGAQTERLLYKSVVEVKKEHDGVFFKHKTPRRSQYMRDMLTVE